MDKQCTSERTCAWITMCKNCKWYKPEETKAPSHEEIWNNTWKDGHQWISITDYNSRDKTYFISSIEEWHSKEWFIGRESATIPPETA